MKKLFTILLFLTAIISNAQTVTDPWAILGPSNIQTAFIAMDASNNLYVTNKINSTISKITPSGTVTQAWATLAAGSNPYGMTIDAAGNLYTVNRGTPGPYTVSKITPTSDGTSGTVIQTWASLGAEAYSISIDASGNLCVPYISQNKIAKIVPANGGATGTITNPWVTLATGANPFSISFDASGNLYTANSNNTISKITPAGSVTQAWATLAASSNPQFMVFDANGNLYVSCWGTSTVSKINTSGTVTNVWSVGTNVWPAGIVLDAAGNIYTANYNNATISKITSSGAVTQAYASLATGSYPFYLAKDATGNLYNTNMGNGTVSKVSGPPSVTITSSASGAICSGTNVTFNAITSGFSNPYYQWYANGTAITGATSSTYSSSSLTNGVQINVKVNEGPFGGDVTSNGLLLNLDAAVQSSYSGSGLTWNNIAPLGNSVVTDFQLTSTNAAYSSDYGGVIRFSSAGGWASSTTGFPNLSSYTVEVWVRPVGTRGDYDPSIAANTNYTPCFFAEKVYNEGAGNRVNMVLAYNARGLTTGTANNSYRYEAAINSGSWKKHQIATDYSSDLNNWVQIVSVYNGSTLTIYRNGVSLGTSSALGISSLRQSTIGYYIAHRWDMTDGVYGDYSKVMMYNKALSTAEVSANYSAFSARFVDNSVSSSSITTTVNASPSVPSITLLGDGCVNKTSLSTPSGLTAYTWYKDNLAISGANSSAYTPTTAGDYKVQVTSGSCSTTSTPTTIFSCGNNAFGKMVALTNASSIISLEGGANFGTGKDFSGKLYNTTGFTTTTGTIGSTTAILGGVISATNAITSSIGIIYSTDASFGTYSTTTIQSNVASGSYNTTITGLTPQTNYFTKSYITNKAGVSYGDVVSFTTTLPTALDAIVLNLDATNNSSYGGSGSIWNDLSGQNNTATFTSTPTYSNNPGSLTFSTASYATTISSTINLTTATFVAWVNPSQIQSNYTGIIYLPKSSTDLNNRYGMQFRTNNSVGYTWGMNGATTYNWDSQLYTPNNQWSMVAISVSANSTTAYLCNASGIISAINTDTHAAASGFKYYVGRDPISYSSSEADLRTFKGKISRVSVYNATLTQADIANIFNAQKSAFGL